MKAYIFCPSHFLNKAKIDIEISPENLYIAADSGITTAKNLGVTVNLLMGDFDSIDMSVLDSDLYKDVKKSVHPKEKDDTDLTLAVKYSLEHGCKNIIIIGGIDGRTDHTLANLYLLKYIKNNGGTGCITNGYNRVQYLSNSAVQIKKDHKYVSVIPMCPEIHGLTLRNFKYPLNNATVTMQGASYTVSNEILPDKDYGEIEISDGDILICETEDIF